MSKAQKPSLALDLARQAAAAAKAEVQADMTEAAPAAPAQRWQPTNLHEGFGLDGALNQAIKQVAGHFARALHYEGLEVAEVWQNSAAKPQSLPKKAAVKPDAQTADLAVQVREGQSGRVVRGYSAPALLGLFASQQQRNGVVVDGQV